jgi:putative transcriptional regulator
MRHHAQKKSALICAFPLLLALASSASAQLATGNLLIATAKSHDPDFAHSVILLILYDSESAIGLMLNKPTSLPITEILPEAKSKSIAIYAGGPIPIGVRGLLRSKTLPFFSVISSRSELLGLISGSPTPDVFRIYAGYVGWTSAQLQNEVARGLWKVLPASTAELFDPHPANLWYRLTRSGPIR